MKRFFAIIALQFSLLQTIWADNTIQNISELTEALNIRLREFGKGGMKASDVQAALLNAVCLSTSEPGTVNVPKLRVYAQQLSLLGKFSLTTRLAIKYEGIDYILEYEKKNELILTGPPRWVVTIEVQHVDSGEQIDWIVVPLMTISADQNKKYIE